MCLRLGLHFVLYPWKCLSSFFHFIIRLRGCCCLVAKSCPALCDPMNCSTPGFPDLHYFPEFAQTHVPNQLGHPVISPCHPLLLLPSIFPSIKVFSNENWLLALNNSLLAGNSFLPTWGQGLAPDLSPWLPLPLENRPDFRSLRILDHMLLFSLLPFLTSHHLI